MEFAADTTRFIPRPVPSASDAGSRSRDVPAKARHALCQGLRSVKPRSHTKRLNAFLTLPSDLAGKPPIRRCSEMISYVMSVAAVLPYVEATAPRISRRFALPYAQSDLTDLHARLFQCIGMGERRLAQFALEHWVGARYITDACTFTALANETGHASQAIRRIVGETPYYQDASQVAADSRLPLKSLRDRSRNVIADMVGLALGEMLTRVVQEPDTAPAMAIAIDQVVRRSIALAPRVTAHSLAQQANDGAFNCMRIASAVAWDAYQHFWQRSMPLPTGNLGYFVEQCVFQSGDAADFHCAADPARSAAELALRMYIDTRYVLEPTQTITGMAMSLSMSPMQIRRFLIAGPNYEKMIRRAGGSPITAALLRRAARNEARECLKDGPENMTRILTERIMTTLDRLYRSSDSDILDKAFDALPRALDAVAQTASAARTFAEMMLPASAAGSNVASASRRP